MYHPHKEKGVHQSAAHHVDTIVYHLPAPGTSQYQPPAQEQLALHPPPPAPRLETLLHQPTPQPGPGPQHQQRVERVVYHHRVYRPHPTPTPAPQPIFTPTPHPYSGPGPSVRDVTITPRGDTINIQRSSTLT